jgi:serine/threonine protein kinase/WD40 repeat protein
MARPPLERVEELFHRVIELEPGARAAFLDAACGADSTLRAAVEELLHHDAVPGQPGEFLAGSWPRPADGFPSTAVAPDRVPGTSPRPNTIGGYEILEDLGRGGMGVVLKARQTALQRLVAIKMLLPAAPVTAEQLGRFRAEAEALARLQHPNVVQIYEIGEFEGKPYFVMEYVDGVSLARKLHNRPQDPLSAARLVETLARAIEVVHEAGIIHRDLKPGNILLATSAQSTTLVRKEADAAGHGYRFGSAEYGVPKITDFGLAKDRALPSRLTQPGFAMGTPCYMAPEQAQGKSDRVAPPADIYALGAILYEMLTGRPPFTGAGPAETVAQVLDEEPVSPALLRPELSRDLATICLKCLEKDPRKRYARAADLADDLRRFQECRPIRARPVGPVGRTWRWCRRRPLVAALTGLSGLLTLGLVVTVLVYQALLQAALTSQLAQTKEQLSATEQEAQRSGQLAEEEQHQLAELHGAVGTLHLEEGDTFSALLWFIEALRLEEGRPERERQYRIWIGAALQHVPQLVEVKVSRHRVHCAALGSAGCWMATVAADGTIQTGNLITGMLLSTGFKPDAGALPIGISPDGRLVATVGPDGTLQIWNGNTRMPQGAPVQPSDRIVQASFSAEGRVMLVRNALGVTQAWNMSTGQRILPESGQVEGAFQAVVSANGDWLFSHGTDGQGRLWDTHTGKTAVPVRKVSQSLVPAAVSADGLRVAMLEGDNAVWLLDTHTGKARLLRRFTAVDAPVRQACFSPDGALLLTAGGDRVRVWDAVTGFAVTPPLWHREGLLAAAFTGKHHVAAVGTDGMLRVWELSSGEAAGRPATSAVQGGAEAGRASVPRSIALPGGKVIWAKATATAGAVRPLQGNATSVDVAVVSPNGNWVVSAVGDQAIQVSDLASGMPVGETLRLKEMPVYAAFSPDGEHIAVAGAGGTVQVWDVSNGERVSPPLRHPFALRSIGFDSDRDHVIAVGKDGQAFRWDLTPDQRSIPELSRYAQILVAHRFRDKGRLRALEPTELVAAWQAGGGTRNESKIRPVR